MNNIEQVDRNICFGCTACAAKCHKNAISFSDNEEGFIIPVVSRDKCVNCGWCVSVCPAYSLWPPEADVRPSVYAVKHKNEQVLLRSSSGGLFSAISDYVLRQGGVIYGVIQDEKLCAIHARAEDESGRNRMCGSKYMQSNPNTTFAQVKNDLRQGKLVLYTGTPCQIDGLSRFIGNSPYKENLILVDLICNGAASPLLFKKYLNFCERKQKSKVVGHEHRPKDKGWGHVEKNIFENGIIDTTSDYSQAWKKVFYSSRALRSSCYHCPYVNLNRPSDITIGDYWGIQMTNINIATNNGVSLYIANTEKGRTLLHHLKEYLIIEESTLEDAIAKQPRLRGIHADETGSNQFWAEYSSRGADFVIRKYGECTSYILFKHMIKRCLIRLGLWK